MLRIVMVTGVLRFKIRQSWFYLCSSRRIQVIVRGAVKQNSSPLYYEPCPESGARA